MHAVHVIPSLSGTHGGPVNALVGLALAQRRQGIDVTVVTGDHGAVESRAGDLESAAIDVVRLPGAASRVWPASRPATRLVAAISAADVVHIHGVWERLLFAAAAVASAARVPYVVRTCGMLDEWALARKPLKKRLYIAWRLRGMLERAAAIHCTSRMEAESTGKLRVRFQRMIDEPNGVAVEEFERLPPRGGFRAAHDIGDRPLIVFLGRVHPGKGLEYLLPSLPLLASHDAVVVVVGPDSSPFAAEMKRRAANLAPRSRVIFTGMLRGPARVSPLVDADVFALPSEHENFGVSVIEALAAGCPVVVSHHVGLHHEIAAHGVGSTTSLAPHAIAAALDDWLGRRIDISRPFAPARRYALGTFDWNRIAARWQAHYRCLVA